MRYLPLIAVLMLATPALAQEVKIPRVITVNGQAEKKIVPDEAHITVNLNAMEPKLADAKSAHDAKLKKLLGIAKDVGIAEKKIGTQSSNVQPMYTARNDPKTGENTRQLQGYRVQTTVDITVADTSKLGDLLNTISSAGFEKGANTEWGDLTSTYYTLSDPDKARDELLADAIKNAHDKAAQMATASGASLGRVYSISEGGVNFPRPMPMMAMRAGMADAMMDKSMAPPAGEQEVNASVTVSYELKD